MTDHDRLMRSLNIRVRELIDRSTLQFWGPADRKVGIYTNPILLKPITAYCRKSLQNDLFLLHCHGATDLDVYELKARTIPDSYLRSYAQRRYGLVKGSDPLAI